MDEQVRWATKAEAARELAMSLSTLDRRIRQGEIEVRREGRRVYVRMEGPEYVSIEERLHRASVREHELERTVRELDGRASELERERDEARESAAAVRQAYEELEEAYRRERAAHGGRRRLVFRLGLAVTALAVVCGLLAWRLLA